MSCHISLRFVFVEYGPFKLQPCEAKLSLSLHTLPTQCLTRALDHCSHCKVA